MFDQFPNRSIILNSQLNYYMIQMINEKTIFTYLFTHFWDMLTDSKRSQALKGSFSVLIDYVGHSLSFKLA